VVVSLMWMIEARKYDQSLHYTLPVRLVEDDGERLWLHAPAGSPINHYTRGKMFAAERAADMFFWRTRWYNVYVNREADGLLQAYYCNVSLPPVVRDSTLSFVDLDLDVRIMPDGSFDILDTDEFRAHSEQYGYPPDVRRAAYEAVADVLILWRARRPPFDQS
jgi:protein associated with RNAse G/E